MGHSLLRRLVAGFAVLDVIYRIARAPERLRRWVG